MIAIMVPLFMADAVFAHKVSIFAWVEEDYVHTISKFSGGKKAMNTPVEVYNNKGKLLLKGVTDNNGEFSFKIPQRIEMTVVLAAGMGHKAKWTIPVDEIIGDAHEHGYEHEHEKASLLKKASVNASAKTTTESISQQDTISQPCLTQYEIQEIVEKVLDEKLKPVFSKLNRVHDPNQPPGLKDILGGLGYIMGLVGIGAYFRYRKKS